MRIASSDTITSGIPKVVELYKGMLINCHYYLKSNLQPSPFQLAKVSGSHSTMSLNNIINLKVNGNIISDIQDAPATQDLFEPSVTYAVVNNNFVQGDGKSYLYRFVEEDNQLKSYTLIGAYEGTIYSLPYQDSQYLFFIANTGVGSIFYRLTKSSNVVDIVYTLTGVNSKTFFRFITEVNDSLYFLVFNNNSMSLCSYYVPSNEFVTKVTLTHEADNLLSYTEYLQDIEVISEGSEYGVYLFNPYQADAPLYRVEINLNEANEDSMLVKNAVSFSWGTVTQNLFFDSSESVNTIVKVFEHEDNTSSFVDILIYNSSAQYLSSQGLYTFKKTTNTNLKFVSFVKLDNNVSVLGSLLSNDRNTVVIGFVDMAAVYRWSASQQSFIRVKYSFTDLFSAGFDSYERLWFTKKDYSVEMLTLTDCAEVNIRYEKSYYEYSGTDIETYVMFSAHDFNNEYFKGKFDLTIQGAAVFTTNNLKTLQINYNSEGEIRVPITITGPNAISIYPQYTATI